MVELVVRRLDGAAILLKPWLWKVCVWVLGWV